MRMAARPVSMSTTVIVPAFNAARFLVAGLESVLAQTCSVEQIVVVDDGSTDETGRLVQQFGGRIQYIWQENQGVSRARNTGLAVAEGQSTLFLDADDCLANDAIECLQSRSQAEGGNCVVFGDAEVVDAMGNVRDVLRRPNLAGSPPSPARAFFNWSGHPPSNFLIPTWAAREVGGFDSRFSYSADSFFLMQVGTLLPFVHIPRTVLRYRQHGGNMSRDVRRATVDSVDSRLAFVSWARERGLSVIDQPPTLLDLLLFLASRSFYTRQWRSLDETLKLAAERGVDSPELSRFRSLRRVPEWAFLVKDSLDRIRSAR